LGLGPAGDVRPHHHGLGAQRFALGGHFLALALVDLGDDHLSPLAGEAQRDGPADVGATTRHDHGLAGQLEIHGSLYRMGWCIQTFGSS
jgi:hypothetical protein